MKRVIPFFILIAMMSALLFSGCGEVNRDNELKEMLSANEDALEDTITKDTCDFELFADYMKSWSESSGVNIRFRGKHSLAIVNDATPGCENEPSVTLLCNFCTTDTGSSVETVATASTALLGPSNHGKITLIITENKDGRHIGINEVPNRFIASDYLINLQTSSSDTILISGPKNATCSFLIEGTTETPRYAKAYEIRMSMPKYTDPYNFVKGSNYPNPINTIGSLLANAKSSGKLFDIASFTCDAKEGYTPNTATAVIVIDSNSVDSILGKFDKSYSNVEDKFDSMEENFVYTITETEMPEAVLSDETSNNLISLMYTLNTGICLQEEETGIVLAASYIKNINTDNGDLSMQLDVRTRGESYLDSISSEYETTAGLCNSRYKCLKKGYVWRSAEKSKLVSFFTTTVPLLEGDSSISLKKYENDEIAHRLPNQDMIIYTFEKNNRKSVLQNITHFMDPELAEERQ
ncbi:MAG: hypothetical protein ACI4KL_00185 [Lentihominibacter sp.]